MIVVQNAHDAACWPNAAISYRRAVERNLGDALGDHYRLWFNDHAAHLPGVVQPGGRSAGAHHPPHRLRRITRAGAARPHGVGRGRHRATGRDRVHARHRPAPHARADRGRARWCPAGRARVRERRGCAPTSAWANRSRSPWKPTRPRAGARSSGSSGTSTAPARSPSPRDGVDGSRASVRLETTHAFDTPGTYFPSVRVTAHRDGDVDAAHCRLLNLGRVRVVVS